MSGKASMSSAAMSAEQALRRTCVLLSLLKRRAAGRGRVGLTVAARRHRDRCD
jgi:hypothetical protein